MLGLRCSSEELADLMSGHVITLNCEDHDFVQISIFAFQIYHLHFMFHSFHVEMNSPNWPTSNAFENWSAYAEAKFIGSSIPSLE